MHCFSTNLDDSESLSDTTEEGKYIWTLSILTTVVYKIKRLNFFLLFLFLGFYEGSNQQRDASYSNFFLEYTLNKIKVNFSTIIMWHYHTPIPPHPHPHKPMSYCVNPIMFLSLAFPWTYIISI